MKVFGAEAIFFGDIIEKMNNDVKENPLLHPCLWLISATLQGLIQNIPLILKYNFREKIIRSEI